ncbi:MAG: nucleotidyltransferase domain-containing protein [Chitinispirillales bacterium]|nr:nucleotidyltransferase domain-containing protein [Chitinispirillales bacterium]
MKINDEILLIKNVILDVVKDCEKIYLFGSFAYGNPNKNSDYDFWVVLRDSKKHPIYTIQKIHKKLGKTKGINTPYDILANSKSKFEERKNLPTLEKKSHKKEFYYMNEVDNGNKTCTKNI